MDLETIKIKVMLDGKEAEVGLSRIRKMMFGSNKPTKSLSKNVVALGKAFKFGGLLKGGLVGAGLGFIVSNARKAANEVHKLTLASRMTGMSTKEFISMGHALGSIGVNAQSAGAVMSGITGGIASLSFGDPAMMSTLASMGIASHSGEKIRSSIDILRDIADWSKRQRDLGTQDEVISAYLQKTFNMQQDLIDKLLVGGDNFIQMIENQKKVVGELNQIEINLLKEQKQAQSEAAAAWGVTAQKLVLWPHR